MILRLPAATLEIVDAEHDAMVDELEAGAPQGNRFRIGDGTQLTLYETP